MENMYFFFFFIFLFVWFGLPLTLVQIRLELRQEDVYMILFYQSHWILFYIEMKEMFEIGTKYIFFCIPAQFDNQKPYLRGFLVLVNFIRCSRELSLGLGLLKLQLSEHFLPISTEIYYYRSGHHRRHSSCKFKTCLVLFFTIPLENIQFNYVIPSLITAV